MSESSCITTGFGCCHPTNKTSDLIPSSSRETRGKEKPLDIDLVVVVAGVMVEEGEVEETVVQVPAGNRLENLFHQLDRNQDGRIDAEELALGLQDLGYAHISPDQIKLFLKKSDATKSGDLSLTEFIEHLSR